MIKHFPILQGRAYVVELPEGAHTFNIINGYDKDGKFPAIRWETMGWFTERLPPGTWQIVGRLSEITESEADELVEWVETGQYYVDYRVDGWWNGDITALESLESAILAEGYGFHSEPEPSYSDCEQYENPMRTYEGRLREWNSKQSRVLCRERCLILKRN